MPNMNAAGQTAAGAASGVAGRIQNLSQQLQSADSTEAPKLLQQLQQETALLNQIMEGMKTINESRQKMSRTPQ